MRELDAVHETTVSLNAFVRHTDQSINQSLFPEIAATAKTLNTSAHAAELSKNAADVSGDVAKATDRMPSIAASLEKLARTASKYQRATILANILATLAKAFIP